LANARSPGAEHLLRVSAIHFHAAIGAIHIVAGLRRHGQKTDEAYQAQEDEACRVPIVPQMITDWRFLYHPHRLQGRQLHRPGIVVAWQIQAEA